MARTTKAALKSTTATVTAGGSVVPMRGKNEQDLMDEKLIKAEASLAMRDADAGKSKLSSADQRMAYAVIAIHAYEVRDDHNPIALSQIHRSDEGRNAFIGMVADKLIGEKPTMSADKTVDDHTAQSRYTAHKALLVRACKLAGVLTVRGVTMADFNDKLGNWTVPFTALFNPADKVDFTNNQKARTVLLDNRTYGATGVNKDGKDKLVKAQASVAQVVRVASPTTAKAGNKVDAGQGTSTAAVDAVRGMSSDALSVAASTVNLVLAFRKIVFDGDTPDTVLSSFGDKVANAWTDIVKLYDVMQKRAADKAAKANKPAA